MGMLGHSVMSNSAIPQTAAHQAPLAKEFSRKNTGVSCHFLLQGIPRNPGIKLTSLASSALEGRSFTTVPPGKSVDGYDLIVKTRSSESDF